MPEGIISFKCPFLYKDSAEGTANYEKVFSKVANAKDEMMVGQLKEIALRRSQLADALKTITPASSIAQLDAAQKTVEETIPFLYAVAQAVEKNPNVKRVGKLVFTWVSACEAKNEVKMCENAWSDVGMAVVSLAILHAFRANQMLETTVTREEFVESGGKSSAAEFRCAAGVMDELIKVILPHIKEEGSYPPELQTTVATAMRDIFIAEGLQVTIKKAVEDGTPLNVVAKLAAGVEEKYRDAETTLSTALKLIETMSPVVQPFVKYHKIFFKAHAHHIMAQHLYKKSKIGLSVAHLKVSLSLLNNGIDAHQKEVKKAGLDGKYQRELEEVARIHGKYENENSHVQYEKVPPAAQLDPIESKVILPLTEYKMPEPAFELKLE
eukprot:CAMPEP_0113872934 /NCGR_PEP_ID=MMETSP0780_2-20120614/3493_1 /TAXON_ID=652834 /ORGANISM="Palpitomonas bilix" /LENGTH=381 /DNA_ID=CAMNT_0000858529 /DNA_START=70 /DNA_END=1215 /DNA_ORIENTATION=- /assembly_acc=CAM_ASM_000599